MRGTVALWALLLSVGVAGVAHARDGEALVGERGAYAGTGRACAGTLRIQRDRISWGTPFSQCATTPFSVIGRRDTAESSQVTYQLSRPGSKCRYKILWLTHDRSEKDSIGWNVVGFASLKEYAPEKPETGLSCYLVK